MSYQYPQPLPYSGTGMGVSHPGYAPNYDAPAPMPLPMDPRNQEQSLKERKESFSQASSKLRRSMSTPNVRPRQTSTSDANQSGLASDKKRNKLGYHRTSVACDQPPLPQATATRPKASSRASSGPNTASASSSPAIPAMQSLDVSQHQQYRPGVMQPATGMPPPPKQPSVIENLGTEATMSSGVVAGSSSRAFGFTNQSVAWMSPELSPSSTTQPKEHNETWRSFTGQSPITPSFSPYTSQAPPSTGWSNADPNAPGDMGYSSFAPGSIMTYPRNTPFPPQYSMAPQQNRQFERKSSTMSEEVYPTQIATQFPDFGPNNASLSAGAVAPSDYGSWVQPPYTYARPHGGYQGWTYEENEGNQDVTLFVKLVQLQRGATQSRLELK
ncbi:hypothetical protein CSUB01_02476 [Colletotrichum sublineola]|uniref:Uncharacterized protein n=1 Tax=Colletotrichum sublineola TaxID=1173701 RepID=A0A066WZZ7_COLSU|nr:hypothetical protein CSUB01_02476 [Colletotrichum sublineola]